MKRKQKIGYFALSCQSKATNHYKNRRFILYFLTFSRTVRPIFSYFVVICTATARPLPQRRTEHMNQGKHTSKRISTSRNLCVGNHPSRQSCKKTMLRKQKNREIRFCGFLIMKATFENYSVPFTEYRTESNLSRISSFPVFLSADTV